MRATARRTRALAVAPIRCSARSNAALKEPVVATPPSSCSSAAGSTLACGKRCASSAANIQDVVARRPSSRP
ncbi:hypothetical protein LP419_08700 [Massilia sp. H-1]|nr:hypothetical protein LP419_08700 [Massilia sp. H-1]